MVQAKTEAYGIADNEDEGQGTLIRDQPAQCLDQHLASSRVQQLLQQIAAGPPRQGDLFPATAT